MTTLLTRPTSQQPAPLDELRSRLTGVVHTPGRPGVRRAVHAVEPRRPDAAGRRRRRTHGRGRGRPRSASPGSTVAPSASRPPATAPRAALAGHLLVVTQGLDEVTVHPEGWARVGAGVKWLRVIEQAAPYGLAPLNGSTSDVGVVGYTTGGGVGPMARTYGLAADKVRAFEVVTGDGEFRRVTPTEHPDLFFALRGGKGATAIVTAVEFDLVHLPTFYGGAVYFDGADAAAVIDRWRDWSAELPEQATTSFAIFQLPAMPGVPPPLAGRMTLSVRFLWTGDADEGARLLDQIRAVAR